MNPLSNYTRIQDTPLLRQPPYTTSEHNSAAALAKEDPYQFQWWALGLVGARPVEQKKGADQGIDGRKYFHDEGRGGKTKQIIFLGEGRTRHGVTHPRPGGGYQPREGSDWSLPIPGTPQPHPCVEKQPQRVSTSLPGESIPAFSCSRLKLSWVGRALTTPRTQT